MMRFEKLHIYGFGKWQDYELELSPFTVLYGENEAGKSTIRAFIKSILFGFAQRGQLRYEPKRGAAYGGAVTLWTEAYGSVKIERLASGVTVYFADGTTGGEAALQQVLGGWDSRLFTDIFSFDLHGLQQVHELDRDQLGSYLLSAGMIGTPAIAGAERALERRMEELFRPNGRKPVINAALQELEQHRAVLQQRQQVLEQYNAAVQTKHDSERALQCNRQEQKQLRGDLGDYETMLALQPLLLQQQKCETILASLGGTAFPADGLARHEQLRGKLQSAYVQLEALREKQRRLQQAMQAAAPDAAILAAAPLVRECLQLQPSAEMAERNWRELTAEQLHIQAEVAELQESVGFSGSLAELTFDVGAKERLRQHVQAVDRLEEQKRDLDARFTAAQEALEEQEAEVERLRQLSAGAAEAAPAYEQAAARQKRAHVLLLLPITIGVLAFGVWQREPAFVWAALVLCALLTVLYAWPHRQPGAGEAGPQQLQELALFKQQQAAQLYDRLALRYEDWERDMYEAKQALQLFRQQYALPADLPAIQLLTAWDRLEKSKQLQRQAQKLEQQRRLLHGQAAQFQVKCRQLHEQLGRDLPAAAQQVKREEEKEVIYRQQQLLLQEQEEELKTLELTIRHLEQERQTLYAAAEADSEEAFVAAGLRWEEIAEQRRQLAVLQPQITMLKERLSAFRPPAAYEQLCTEAEAELQRLRREEEGLQRQAAEAQAELQQLDGGRTYHHLLHEWEQQRSQLQEQVRLWAVHAAARTILINTKNRYREERLPRILAAAEQYFSILTGGVYVRIFLPEGGTVIAERQDGLRFTGKELSQATAEQLYMSMRLALATAFETAYPLILDDSFVHFDQERLGRAVQLLRQLHEHRQVLYFTCQPHVAQLFPPDSVRQLS